MNIEGHIVILVPMSEEVQLFSQGLLVKVSECWTLVDQVDKNTNENKR